MIWKRSRSFRSARRIGVVDDFRFPASVRHGVGNQHPDLDTGDIHLVEDAAKQWFRIVARHPRAELSMPSVIVDDLWREVALHTRDYAALCEAAFGRFLPYEPVWPTSADAVDTDRTGLLLATLTYARRDERCSPADLPLLFRIDRELGVEGGNRYMVDCGGRGECFEVPGMVCLQHLAGPGKRQGARGTPGFAPSTQDGWYGYSGGL